MESNKFEKIDTARIAKLHSKINDGSTAIPAGIALIVVGIFMWIIALIILSADSSFSDAFAKYFTMVLFLGFGLMFNIIAVVYLKRGVKHKIIVHHLLTNGLLTEGCIINTERKSHNHRYFGRSWKYKLTYTYTDDKGISYNESIVFVSQSTVGYEQNKTIKIAFYNGQSAMVETK